MRRLVLLSAAATLLGSAAVSAADVPKAQCVSSNTLGQSLRIDGKFAEARKQLETCADPSCPGIVRVDCRQRLADLDRAQPTIVFDVADRAGATSSSVDLAIDGKPFGSYTSGTAIPVDPGTHAFTFHASGRDAVTQEVSIREGEKRRSESVMLATPAAGNPAVPAPATAPLPSTPAPPVATPPGGAHSGLGTQQVLGLSAGAIGAAGLVVGGIFGALTLSAASQQKSDCAGGTSCSSPSALDAASNDHSSGVTDGAVSTAGFVAGGALVALGAILFFTGRHGSERVAALQPSLGPGVAGLSLGGTL